MKTWSKCCSGLAAVLTLTPSLWSQIPAPPVVPAPPPVPAAVPAVPVAAPRKGLLEQCADMKARCKAAFCASPFGALTNSALRPVTAFSGGLIGGCCPTGPSLVDLAKPPDSAEGAAAQIKKAEAEAKARRAAVRYLGTVDCHWFPEAEAGLINALRGDTNECVRLEAALALANGCCCTRKTIAALTITVSGSTKDGKPSENSERVKAAAGYALQHCLACYIETEVVKESEKTPVEPPTPALPPPVEKPTAMIGGPPSAYYLAIQKVPMKQLVEEARRTLADINKGTAAAAARHHEDYSLYGMLTRAMSTPAESASTTEKPGAVSESPPVATNTSSPSSTPAQEPKAISASAVPVVQATPTEKHLAASAPQPSPTPAREVKATALSPTPMDKPLTAPTPPPTTMKLPQLPPTPTRELKPTAVSATQMEKPVAAPAPPPTTMKFPQSSPTTAREVNSFATPTSSVVQGSTNQGSMVGRDSNWGKIEGTGTASSRMSSLVAWQKSGSSPSSGSVEATSAQAPPAPLRPVAAVQPVVRAPIVPAVASAGVAQVKETRDTELPLPGATKVTVDQLMAVLRKATVVAQREWAAENLASFNWQEMPVVAEALLKAAREDSSSPVRVACVRSLITMGVYTPSARAVFQALKNDADSRVRLEAEAALRNLGSN